MNAYVIKIKRWNGEWGYHTGTKGSFSKKINSAKLYASLPRAKLSSPFIQPHKEDCVKIAAVQITEIGE